MRVQHHTSVQYHIRVQHHTSVQYHIRVQHHTRAPHHTSVTSYACAPASTCETPSMKNTMHAAARIRTSMQQYTWVQQHTSNQNKNHTRVQNYTLSFRHHGICREVSESASHKECMHRTKCAWVTQQMYIHHKKSACLRQEVQSLRAHKSAWNSNHQISHLTHQHN